MNEQEAVMMRFVFEAISSLSRAKYQDIARTVARDPDAKHRLSAAHATELLASAAFHAQLKRALTLLQLASYIQRDGETWFVTPHGQGNQGTLKVQQRAENLIRELEADFGAQIDALSREHSEVIDDEASEVAPATRERIELGGALCARNTILYGPPGTGKTHATVQHAVALARHGRLATEADVREQRAFDQLRAEGRISFVTFHQSYAYEDFVEGLRPETVGGQIRYEVRPGTFRKIVQRALEALYAAPRVATRRPFEEVWAQLVARGVEASGSYSVELLPDERVRLSERQAAAGTADRAEVDRRVMQTIYELGEPRVGDAGYRAAVQGLFEGDYPARKMPVAAELWRLMAPYAVGEQRMIDASQVEHYVLVIDEINRGNMSRIFGELITLLEPSKRLGMEDALEVELPASGETFGVPPNLHILGTMNTADRSIALLDVALRRRFKFVELMPNAELVGDVQARRVMEAINGRLELLLDREHQLGHALFMGARGAEEVLEVVRRDVLPLLKEYFYGDWERIAAVLGCSGATEDEEDALVYTIDVGARGLPVELLREEALRWRERLVVADAGAVLERIVEGEA